MKRIFNPLASKIELVPTAALVVVALALARVERGSVAGRDWLGYATVVALLAAVLALAGLARRPSRAALVSIGALLALAGWSALTLLWAPLPSLARDEGLLVAFYALALAVPAATLRSARSRPQAVGLVVAGLGGLALLTALELRFGSGQLDAYRGSGRLYFPVGYVNAQAALMLVGFWPAVLISARREGAVALRAAGVAAATLLLAVATMTQSRSAAVAMAVTGLIVFAALPNRLRLLLPVLLPVALVGAGFRPLTGTFDAAKESPGALADAIRTAGATALLLGLAALVLGLAYAAADRRISVPARARRIAGATIVAIVALATVAGVAVAAQRVDEPRTFLSERWEAFKQEPEEETAATHLLSPGSNRYDFWRVSLLELRDHPVAGAGARSFGPAYLRRGASGESPARAHSLPLDVLSETGIVGFLLLAAAVGVALVVALRKRRELEGAAALAGGAYWLLHAATDWTWTFPAVGLPFFVLLGIALSANGPRLPRLTEKSAAAVLALLAVLAFAPPWIAARYTQRAVDRGLPAATDDLRRARFLDPLSTEPLLVESVLAPGRSARIDALERAAEREPASVRVQYRLGIALLEAGRKREARVALLRAQRLYPREELIDQALRRTG